MKTALYLIIEERQRQIEKEGYDLEHDDQHDDNELSFAAACYATHPLPIYIKREYAKSVDFERLIPFDDYEIDDKKSSIRKKVIAAALLLADIERELRLEKKS